MHSSNGLTAPGIFCPLRSQQRDTIPPCIFKTHGKEEVRDAWPCFRLSNSARINSPEDNAPRQAEPSEMALLGEHGIYPLQLHSC